MKLLSVVGSGLVAGLGSYLLSNKVIQSKGLKNLLSLVSSITGAGAAYYFLIRPLRPLRGDMTVGQFKKAYASFDRS